MTFRSATVVPGRAVLVAVSSPNKQIKVLNVHDHDIDDGHIHQMKELIDIEARASAAANPQGPLLSEEISI